MKVRNHHKYDYQSNYYKTNNVIVYGNLWLTNHAKELYTSHSN